MGKARRLKQDRHGTEPTPAADRQPARPRPTRTPLNRTSWMLTLAPLGVIIVVGLVLYANSFSVPFIFDDQIEIINNPKVKELHGPIYYLTQSRGIVLFSLAANYAWNGMQISGFHRLNLFIHLVNGMLVYALVLTTLRLPFFGQRYARHAQALALAVALVFLAHPLQTMAVTYVIQRAESIASMFYLIALLLFVRGTMLREDRRQWVAYAGAGLAGFFGVLTKEIVVTLPFMMGLYYICFLGADRPQRQRRRFWWIFAALLVVVGYAVFLSWQYLIPGSATVVQRFFPRNSYDILTAGFALEGVTAWQYLMTEFLVIVTYLRLFFLPTNLVFDYGWPFVDSPWRPDVIWPFLFLVGLVVVAIAAFRRYRLATFCIGWFFIVLAPSSSFIPLKDAYFEHRMYLGVAGLALLVVVGAYDVITWLAARQHQEPKTLLTVGTVAAGIWIAALGWLTIARNQVYADPLALATDSAAKSPHNWRAKYDVGNELRKRNQIEEAIAAFKQAIEEDPTQGPPRIHLGILYLQQNKLAEAEQVLKPAMGAPEASVMAAAHRTLGFVYEAEGNWIAAMNSFHIASEIMPDWSMVRKHLARMYAKNRRWQDAITEYEAAMRLNADMAKSLRGELAEPYMRLGVTAYLRGDRDEAARLFQSSLRYRSNNPQAHHYLALTYAGMGQRDKAIQEISIAERMLPGDQVIAQNGQKLRDGEPTFMMNTTPDPGFK